MKYSLIKCSLLIRSSLSQGLTVIVLYRGGATGWAGWAFAHPVFQRSEAKNPSKLQNSCNLYVPTVDVVKI